jgi:hypothetical protein
MTDQRQQWLTEAVNQIPTVFYTRDEAIEMLTALLPRCRAQSKSRFWQWLRLQLAKSTHSNLLAYLKEPADPTEPLSKAEPPFPYKINGNIALIDLGICVWKVPVRALDWVRSVWPVYAKQLPAVQTCELRELKRQYRQNRKDMSPVLREQFRQSIGALEKALEDAPPRFAVYKSGDGRDIPIHQLYLSAEPDEEIGASDGDYANYCDVQAIVTVRPVFEDGATCLPGIADPTDLGPRVEQVRSIPNLYLKCSSDNPHPNRQRLQNEWEKKILQAKSNEHGDIVTTLRTQPNADLGKRTGIEGGRIADCGKFVPLSHDELSEVGLQGVAVNPNAEVRRIQKAWEVK